MEYQGRRAVYREVLIFLETLSLLTSTAKLSAVAGRGTSRSGNCSFIKRYRRKRTFPHTYINLIYSLQPWRPGGGVRALRVYI
jgi:hypothetical protein